MSSIIVFVQPDLNVCEAATNSMLVYLRGRLALFVEVIDRDFELPGGAHIEVGDGLITLH